MYGKGLSIIHSIFRKVSERFSVFNTQIQNTIKCLECKNITFPVIEFSSLLAFETVR